jgi:hypothetical protein
MRNVCGVRSQLRLRDVLCAVTAMAFIMLVSAPVAAAAVPNPHWPAQCPQRVVIALDLSSSTKPYLSEIKKSASDLVDALRGAPNEVAVITFGTGATVAVPPLDVGLADQRSRVKDLIDDVALPPGDGGGTNWEEALRTAAGLHPGIVLFLTDGEPTVTGSVNTGYANASDNLTPAVQAADSMRSSGIRIVGVGMGLQPAFVPNLVQITGPTPGDDYYETGTNASGLLDQLYDVASKTCGIPVAALPQPEGGHFPVAPVVLAVLGAALLVGVGGYVISKRRSDITPGTAVERSAKKKLTDTTIRKAGADSIGQDQPEGRPGRMSLDRLHQLMDAQPEHEHGTPGDRRGDA